MLFLHNALNLFLTSCKCRLLLGELERYQDSSKASLDGQQSNHDNLKKEHRGEHLSVHL